MSRSIPFSSGGLFLFLGATVCFFFGLLGPPAGADRCRVTRGVLAWTIEKIKAHPQVTLRVLSCSQLAELDSFDPDQLAVTTGRLSGMPLICISSTRSNPCRYVLADLERDADPTQVLTQIFDYTPTSTILNETVERLFIRPSKYFK